jgi:hypothetical protein
VVQIVCVLGVRRSGSTRVISLLSGFEGLYVKEEIFNRRSAATLEDESHELGLLAGFPDVADIRDRRLIDWLRANPNTTLDWLVERGGGRPLVFKLFPNHVSNSDEEARLLARLDIGFIVVRRSPIDAYISMLKAQATGTMHGVDTTLVEVRGDLEQFLKFLATNQAWYERSQLSIASAGRPHVQLTYQRHIAVSDEVAIEALKKKLNRLGVDPGKFRGVSGQSLVRQDLSPSWEDKMVNWAEFSKQLATHPACAEAFAEEPLSRA